MGSLSLSVSGRKRFQKSCKSYLYSVGFQKSMQNTNRHSYFTNNWLTAKVSPKAGHHFQGGHKEPQGDI